MNFRFRTHILIAVLALLTLPVVSQVRPGIKFGVSTPDVSPKDILVTNQNGEDYYRIAVENARYGVHGGIFIQMQIGGFFIQPEILYNSTSVDYTLDELLTNTTVTFRDTYRNLDFPLMLGLKSGVIRLGGGPVGHLKFDGEQGFEQYGDYSDALDDFTWGWQAGVGFDLWKLHLDFRYEGNFTQLGEQITFFGKSFDFATANNRMIASLGFSF